MDRRLLRQPTTPSPTRWPQPARLPASRCGGSRSSRDYEDTLTSQVADADNAPGGPGAITAALFLQHFAGDVPWAHLDLASTGDSPNDSFEWTKGPSGFGPRALLTWLDRPRPAWPASSPDGQAGRARRRSLRPRSGRAAAAAAASAASSLEDVLGSPTPSSPPAARRRPAAARAPACRWRRPPCPGRG